MEKSIYELELHEGITINDQVSAMRVPGGWLYTITVFDSTPFQGSENIRTVAERQTSQFVPYHNEFTKHELKRREKKHI